MIQARLPASHLSFEILPFSREFNWSSFREATAPSFPPSVRILTSELLQFLDPQRHEEEPLEHSVGS